eukprot:3476142-Rhodomonas_salina.1
MVGPWWRSQPKLGVLFKIVVAGNFFGWLETTGFLVLVRFFILLVLLLLSQPRASHQLVFEVVKKNPSGQRGIPKCNVTASKGVGVAAVGTIPLLLLLIFLRHTKLQSLRRSSAQPPASRKIVLLRLLQVLVCAGISSTDPSDPCGRPVPVTLGAGPGSNLNLNLKAKFQVARPGPVTLAGHHPSQSASGVLFSALPRAKIGCKVPP